MLFKKFQQLAQWIGFLTIAGFALYGIVTLGSGRAWAVGNTAPSAITIPSTFNYQGFLRDAQGNPITGTRKIKVSLWTAVTAGTELYTETFTGVSVRDGLFNVVMGSTQSMSPTYFQNVAPLFVGIAVDDGAELLPRQRIHPVPWALTSTTLVPDASVTNLTNSGLLYVSADKKNYIGPSENPTFVDGLFFWGNKGFAWIAKDANGYLMTLKQETGAWIDKGLAVGGSISSAGTISSDVNVNVGNNLNVAGGMFLNGESPVLIKRINDYQLANNNPGTIPTGVLLADYWCTMAGWDASYDVKEGSTGRWSRHLYTIEGQWHVYFRSHVDNAALKVNSVEVVCYRYGILDVSVIDAATGRTATDAGSLDLSAPPSEQE
ncbi:MAG: hypothetical protein KF893_18145 [Caldilineaceae bacterium]|nr:hypothetical protein [Caldilineaceae bacterium]